MLSYFFCLCFFLLLKFVFLPPIQQPFPWTLSHKNAFNFLLAHFLTPINNPPIFRRSCWPFASYQVITFWCFVFSFYIFLLQFSTLASFCPVLLPGCLILASQMPASSFFSYAKAPVPMPLWGTWSLLTAPSCLSPQDSPVCLAAAVTASPGCQSFTSVPACSSSSSSLTCLC